MAKRASRRNKKDDGDDLQKQIEKAGLDWQAEPDSADQPALGLKHVDSELEQLAQAIADANAVEEIATSFGAPAQVDWRNNNGNWVTPVKNQRSCGSCVSFATCAQLESRIQIVCRDSNRQPDLSEAHLFFCGCGNCCNNGWFFTNALDVAKTKGVGLDADFPYTPNDQPCRQIDPYIKVESWRRVLSTNERKSVIASRGPVMAGMKVYSDFSSYRSGVYRRTPGSTYRGNHAVVVVGYSDPGQYWIVKNSWGTGWGEQGYFRIAYNEADVGLDTIYPFYDVTISCPTSPETDTCQRYVPFLRRVLVLSRSNRRLQGGLRYYVCRRGSRPSLGSWEIRVIRYTLQILRQCPQYQTPFCRAVR